MFVTKLKVVAVILFVVSLAAGGGVLTHGWTAVPPAEPQAEDPVPKQKDERKDEAKPLTVKVVEPKRGGLAQAWVLQADVVAAQQQQLFPLVSGTVKEVAVDMGDRVKKGQVLIVVDAPLLTKDVEQAAAALEMAQAQRDEAEVIAESAKQDVERGLSERVKFIRAQAALKAAKANVKLAHVALDKARIQEGFMRLRAEFDGVVAERKCDPGNFVQGGEGRARQPLLTLVRTDRLRVKVPLDPDTARIAERGDPVELSAEGIIPSPTGLYTGLVLKGNSKDFLTGLKIDRISPIVDGGASGTRSVVIDVENPRNRLVPGATVGVQIHFKGTRNPDVFTVPRSCVFEQDGKYSVYTVRDGKAHRRQVTIGNFEDDEREVVDGIKASDLIITTNPKKLHEGAPVKIEKSP